MAKNYILRTVAQRVREMLLQLIKSGNNGDPKLPSEETLCKELGIGLPTLREALAILRQQGYLSKIHGSGNFIHPSACDITMRIDITHNMRQLLETEGYTVRTVFQGKEDWQSTAREKDILGLTKGIKLKFLWLADEQAAIYEEAYFPEMAIESEEEAAEGGDNHELLFWKYYRKRLEQAITNFVPAISNEAISALFGLKPNTPITVWEQIYYDYKDQPLGVADFYFNPEIVKMHMVRKWY